MKTLKKIMFAAVAASVVAAPAAAAPFGRDNDRRGVETVQKTKVVQRRNGRQVVKVTKVRQNQFAKRNWRRGERFDTRYARNYQVISNHRAYRLQAPPRGYRWVRSDNDAVLVAITSGLIGAVLGNIF